MIVTRCSVALAVCLAPLLAGCTKPGTQPTKSAPPSGVIHIDPGPNAQEEVQTALLKVKPGQTIELGAGTFAFTQSLSLKVNDVTLRGQGMDKTVLSFKNQVAGKEGLLVGGRDHFTIEDLAVEDTKGDAIKVEGGDGVIFRRVRAQWNGGGKESNGAYGLYPVQCKNVLIDGCVAIGASDAGIYVGQSRNIIVRNCRAEQNVAGIEIENSMDADVHDNTATNNAGGLLVFDLPGLQVKNGRRIRVYRNQVFANNHPNFAPKGNIVASVPPGTGLIVMATDQVEVFRNTSRDNQTYNMAVVSYKLTGRPIEDKDYDPYPEQVYIHDNVFENGGTHPGGERGDLLAGLAGKPIPDIVYDGITSPKAEVGKQQLFLKNNGRATFVNLRWGELPDLSKLKSETEAKAVLGLHKLTKVSHDSKPFEGELPPLPEVKLPGVAE
jgi:parallel beta-helix repeat protein